MRAFQRFTIFCRIYIFTYLLFKSVYWQRFTLLENEFIITYFEFKP